MQTNTKIKKINTTSFKGSVEVRYLTMGNK